MFACHKGSDKTWSWVEVGRGVQKISWDAGIVKSKAQIHSGEAIEPISSPWEAQTFMVWWTLNTTKPYRTILIMYKQ